MGGQVLPPDPGQDVAADVVRSECVQRPGEPLRAVELSRREPVVEAEHVASIQRGRHFGQPIKHGEVDLGELPFSQTNATFVEPLGKSRCRQVAYDVDEMTVRPTEEDLLQPARLKGHAVDGQGIKELVGQDDAANWLRRALIARLYGLVSIT